MCDRGKDVIWQYNSKISKEIKKAKNYKIEGSELTFPDLETYFKAIYRIYDSVALMQRETQDQWNRVQRTKLLVHDK